ncbi:hypothetical protein [Methylobacterium nodulans]|uniref:Uncharacterized protein n=1 Tax=Methylobacterium nodulans (strain LMG 21967 / CNCM I-2342 / ORS 2060) TaxID=460265 RepID=B8IVA6_METNO|nr:hypothetical protein [Methylobacterium nodulans]ACL60957.1 conserved hypothetical protein [Methylobacterium nodulans ORS 2060]
MDTFTVTVETLIGPLYLRRETAEAAIATGRVLQREGIGQVFITPPSGRPFPLADFVSATEKDRPKREPA